MSVRSSVASSLNLLNRKQKIAVVLFSFSSFCLSILDLLALALLALVASIGTSSEVPVELAPLSLDARELILGGLGSVTLIFMIKTIGGLVIEKKTAIFLADLETGAATSIVNNVFRGSLQDFRRKSSAELNFAILHSTATAYGGIIGSALKVFAELTVSVLIVGFFVIIDWQTALGIVFYFAVVVLLFQSATAAISTKAGSKITEGYSDALQAIGDLAAVFREISVLSRQDFFISRTVQSRAKIARAEAAQKYLGAIPRLIVEMALIVGGVAFIGFEIWRNPSEPDFATLAVFLVGSFRIMAALLPLQRAYAQLRFLAPQASAAQAEVSLAKAAGVDHRALATSELDKDLPHSKDSALSVHARNLGFHYLDRSESFEAITDVSLDVRPGSMVAIVGPSGAGKSTLVDLILGLHEPSSGEVLLSGLPPTTIRSKFPGLIAYVPQKPGIVSGSLRANVALGMHDNEIDDDRISAVLEQSELLNWVDSLPEGSLTHLGQHSDSLSGGQIQRLGLARALYHRPRLLVLDEATNALDPETESLVSTALENLSDEVTRIVIAHQVLTVQKADVVCAMREGRILASGTFKQLRRDVPFFETYVQQLAVKD